MSKTLYYGGDIITMEGDLYVQSVIIENGIIVDAGEKSRLELLADNLFDLKGNTMMPSFIDAHSHITAWANAMVAAPLNDLISLDEIKKAMLEFIKKSEIEQGDWVSGFGYDQNLLEGRKHPTRQFLDSISTEIPLIIAHTSGHMGVANSKALNMLEIDKNTKNPGGGLIGKDEAGELTGYLEENVFFNISSKMPKTTMEQFEKNIKRAEQEYFKYGVTTIQDGFTSEKEWKALSLLAQEDKLIADIICYIDLKNSKALLEQQLYKSKYHNRLKIGGYKIFLDGSPQGRTAWMTQGYEDDKNYFGYPIYSDKEVLEFVNMAIGEGQQLLAHCNGDAACQQFIDAIVLADKQYGFTNNFRPVMIHSQLATKKQLPQMFKLGMIASFFVAHIYQWGDVHLRNFGKRGENISIINSALKEGVLVTLHQDCPVLPPDMFFSIWCACKRQTKNGVMLSEGEKVTTLEALKAVTINIAYQYFEEDKKGSIKVGKKADFIIVDKNPLKCDIDELKSIKILQTFKNGNSVYKL